MSEAISVFRGGGRAIRAGLGLGALGTIALGIGAWADRRRLFLSYLAAYAFAVSIAVGALIFLLVCHAMRAGWPVAIRRVLEAIVATFPVLAVQFVPIALGLDVLYPWMSPDRAADPKERALLFHKRPYLNAPFFLARAALFLAVWVLAAALVRRWSFRQDHDPDFDAPARLYRFSAALLPAVALTMSFAAFDWIMSLTPLWESSMFPVYFFAGGFVSAIALASVLTYSAQASGHLPEIADSHYYALGRLLLAFIIFWAYAAYFQFMLIWIGNRPDEVTFYLARAHGPWMATTVVLALGEFVVPFCFLLSFRVKRHGALVAAIGAWILVFHYLDILWLVMPSASPKGLPPLHWIDLASLLAVGGPATAAGLLSARGRPLLPIHDRKLAEALAYESP